MRDVPSTASEEIHLFHGIWRKVLPLGTKPRIGQYSEQDVPRSHPLSAVSNLLVSSI